MGNRRRNLVNLAYGSILFVMVFANCLSSRAEAPPVIGKPQKVAIKSSLSENLHIIQNKQNGGKTEIKIAGNQPEPQPIDKNARTRQLKGEVRVVTATTRQKPTVIIKQVSAKPTGSQNRGQDLNGVTVSHGPVILADPDNALQKPTIIVQETAEPTGTKSIRQKPTITVKQGPVRPIKNAGRKPSITVKQGPVLPIETNEQETVMSTETETKAVRQKRTITAKQGPVRPIENAETAVQKRVQLIDAQAWKLDAEGKKTNQKSHIEIINKDNLYPAEVNK